MGSKSRYAKYIVPILQKCIDENNIDTYVEAFVGGANIIDKIKAEHRIGSDNNPYLIAVLKKAAEDPKLFLNPEETTEAIKPIEDIPKSLWDDCRDTAKIHGDKYPDWFIGFVSFMASYCAGGFGRGYGRTGKTKQCISKNHFNNFKKQIPDLVGIDFFCSSYIPVLESYIDKENCLIYLDPPYRDTKHYDMKEEINYEQFYDLCREVGKNNYVFISEQYMPDDFKVVWSKEVKRLIRSTRAVDGVPVVIENLYTIGKSNG
jgi:DNA adenine methylase